MTHASRLLLAVFASFFLAIATQAADEAATAADDHATMGHGQGASQGVGMGQGMGHGMMMGRGGGMGMMMGGCPMMGGIMGAGGGKPFAEGRIAFLKAELAITDTQEAAWKPYADAIRKNLDAMRSMHARMQDVMGAKTPVARLDAHIAVMEGRLASLKDLKPLLATLYDILSDEQKKKADELLTGMGCMM